MHEEKSTPPNPYAVATLQQASQPAAQQPPHLRHGAGCGGALPALPLEPPLERQGLRSPPALLQKMRTEGGGGGATMGGEAPRANRLLGGEPTQTTKTPPAWGAPAASRPG